MTLLEELPTGTFSGASMPVLETERLTLRAPRLEDAKAIAALAGDRRVAENTRRIPHPYRVEDAEQFIAKAGAAMPNEMALMVIEREGDLVGGCSLTMLDGPAPEVIFWLGVPFWGQGYATEALRAIIDHAFTDLDHKVLQAGTRVTNPASRRILEKCGFQWTGVGLHRIRSIKSSAPIDHFRLDRGLWQSLKSWGQTRRVA
ncbi:putative succinyl-CoA transferase [Variibacter gotjawalensis]|uniref:Putative succinyl-CoA transferase n=1 Tax=Variibacter gotjawalensis TaxID=1333996 RepID=A0A0S3PR57_9BRAD|nr:GNAT family N-acetyltransferase [Variibacter gotjawalensis]NIK48693.1 RimJ/RimL family protein N-acetyltransferase [Variibacter gotjawalensis]RZS50554.1 RimJ/RimL family protein N-acetyltransferase [Variibacter gotjawalensis]BAT58388.1 putative succinyl-CoA transferase [Variibacter gotjawalensis]